MTTYTTQMDAARKGIVTPQIKTVAEKEHMPVEKLMELVAEGKVAICANKTPHLSESGRCRQHAPHKDQRKPRCFQRLQRL